MLYVYLFILRAAPGFTAGVPGVGLGGVGGAIGHHFGIMCCPLSIIVFVLCLASNVVRVSGLSILYCPFGSPWRLLIATGILAASQMNGKFLISSELWL